MSDLVSPAPPQAMPQVRLRFFDTLRGFSIVSMVAFHYCYDLKFLAGATLPFFTSPLLEIWRASISWTFLFIAGCMCSRSRDNLRRGLRYLLTACVIYLVTLLAAIDTPISFGIIFCMGASTLLAALLDRLGLLNGSRIALAVLLVIFVLLLPLSSGRIGLGGASIGVPRQLYSTPLLSWLGFPGPNFSSGDYYPVLPYVLMYLAGAVMGKVLDAEGYPRWMSGHGIRSLEFLGRHALPIYLLHQPLLLLLSGVGP